MANEWRDPDEWNINYGSSGGGGSGGSNPWGSILGLLGANNAYQNPASAGNPFLEQIRGQITPYYQPYINAGLGALGNLQGQYGQLLNDPGGKLNQIGQGFQQSPGFQFSVDQATNAANNAAAAGGTAGSPASQQGLAKTITGYANQDYNNWLGQATGLYGRGLQGEEGINQMGYNASDQLAQSIMSQLMSQAQMAYMGAGSANAQSGGMWGGIGSLLGSSGGIGGLVSSAMDFLGL